MTFLCQIISIILLHDSNYDSNTEKKSQSSNNSCSKNFPVMKFTCTLIKKKFNWLSSVFVRLKKIVRIFFELHLDISPRNLKILPCVSRFHQGIFSPRKFLNRRNEFFKMSSVCSITLIFYKTFLIKT